MIQTLICCRVHSQFLSTAVFLRTRWWCLFGISRCYKESNMLELRTSSLDNFYRVPKVHSSYVLIKVEKILKGSLDLISSTSPSVKIQIIGGKFCLRCEGKTFLFSKVCWQRPAIFCLYTSSKLSHLNLNFHWRWSWWDQIQAIFQNLFFFNHGYFFGEHTGSCIYT